MAHPVAPYQREDLFLHDYELYSIPGLPNLFRGPAPPQIESANNIAFFGTAHTFGSLCRFPFPSMLASMLDSFALNLAAPGASPDWYLRQQRALDLANSAKLLVMQVLPARNSPNRLLTNEPSLTGVRLRDGVENNAKHAFEVYKTVLQLPRTEIDELVEETRANYVASMLKLAEKIRVPKVLLYFSNASPDRTPKYDNVQNFFGGFPQLVNRACVDRMAPAFDAYVEVVSSAGFPAPFISRFTGEVITVMRPDGEHKNNGYYPSQAMHVLAAQKLYDGIKKT